MNLTSFIKHVRPMISIKPQISLASVIGLGYNTFSLYPRSITLAKTFAVLFVMVIGLTCLIEPVRFFNRQDAAKRQTAGIKFTHRPKTRNSAYR